jgi:hypothetical protein
MKITIVPIFLFSALATFFITSTALANATLMLEPSAKQVDLGNEFTLDILISDVKGLFGASFEVQYDETFLDYLGMSAGDFMGADVLPFDFEGDNSVSIAVTMKAGANAANGSGVIATLTFIAKAKGTPQISLHEDTLSLISSDGAAIPVTAEDGSVTVIDPAEPSPALSIDLSMEEVPVGQQFPIEVKAANVSQLFGVAFELQFDATILKAISTVPGDFLGTDVVAIAVPGDGSMSVSISRKAGVGGVDGSGAIAIVTLEAIARGDSDISFNSETITLSDSDGNPVAGADMLEAGTANVSVQPPALVPARRLVKTWGAIKRL